ncbi:hypothetical protein [Gloeocapsa sp. PCC 73106]|uniref:hypothetical protein n=1 Tax=Gloeocapsa sp. PCC 73106 TaxID=102232 RepID=UPI0002ABBE17|nr:hypothetical protein [Gloeocapsa sp. PCC 73106]ELR98764.1 hypothetical protein GLO73106DRAFT_00026020 [Gloeocapsa sp. PCC 73106]
MQLSSATVNLKAIALQLQGHKQLQRLKKLIYYTSTSNWENDVEVLNNLTLEQLLEQLYQANSTLDELSDSLYQSVDTLNRQNVYTELANLIIAKLGLLYQDSDGATGVIAIKSSIRDNVPDSMLTNIVVNLNQHPELARIKKLVFYLAKDQWESDINAINGYNFQELILSLRELYPNFRDLEKAFSDLVATLNRQHLYLAVSETITQEMSKLYQTEEGDTQLSNQTLIMSKEPEENLTLPQQKQQLIEAETIVKQHETIQNEEKKTIIYTSFDWRLDIMQYSNPLRVKILLFSLVYHQFQNNDKDWAKLKSCTLDDLVSKIKARYQSLIEIETLLHSIAEASIERELNLQTAAVIIKSIMSFYETN